MQVCKEIGWRPAMLPPPPCAHPAEVAQLLSPISGLRQPELADLDDSTLLEEPTLPPALCSARAIPSTAVKAFHDCMDLMTVPRPLSLKEMPVLSLGTSLAAEDAVFLPTTATEEPARKFDGGATAEKLQMQVRVQELPPADREAQLFLEEPLFPPLTAVLTVDCAAIEKAVLAAAVYLATTTGTPTAAAALVEPALPQHFLTYECIVSTSMLGEEESAQLPHVHIDDSVGSDRHSAESGVAEWRDFCAQCNVKRVVLATTELKLDWSLIGPPGSGVTPACHRTTVQVVVS